LQYFKIKNKIKDYKTLIIKTIKRKIINIVKNIFKFEIKQKQLNAFDVALKKNVIVITKTKLKKNCCIKCCRLCLYYRKLR